MNNRVESGAGRSTLPLGFWFLLSGSLAERAAFQGIRVVLVLFLIELMGYSEGEASSLVSWFVALCYLFPLAAAWLGDRWLLRSQSLLLFAIIATVGYAILPIGSAEVVLFAVILIALGSGGVKTHAPTLIGVTLECHRSGDLQLRSAAFSYLYAGINVAWVVAALGFPVLRAEFGYRQAFWVIAATMALSAAMFVAGRRHYGSEPITDAACTRDIWSAVKKMGFFAPTIVFWSLFEQSATTWTLFVRDHVDLSLGSLQLHPDMIQGLNPILVLLLAPFWRWAVVRLSRSGITMHSESQVLLGFAFSFLSALAIAIAAAFSARGQLVSFGWMAAAHFFLAAAELGVAAASLEVAFTEGPPRLKAFFGACWLLMPFFGNVLNAAMAPFYDALGSQTYFAMLAAIVGLGCFSFFGLTAAAGRRRKSCSFVVPQSLYQEHSHE
ncbi:Dipeptide and tripeptide permease A [Gimesia chilikensis]|uniref:Dipeptide and tripeptide permease A n=1 Tax=Gimesia chilikensis TaxID=2605989 RepID=A0A517WAZ1_9PLAN|nr:MFS transporter [Gimesia chilikensis]QDU02422.1 Dipeptide and tripeptide permease A [Gimesia chilikensis]